MATLAGKAGAAPTNARTEIVEWRQVTLRFSMLYYLNTKTRQK
jgi:hypothetical protein